MTSDGIVPLVSVGLPVYNGEKYLADALDSILGQTLGDIEVVISDNASTDRTAEICQEYAARDPRIRYHRQATNLGGAPNFNFVFLESRGRFFKWAAHDDICAPLLLESCVAALEEHPDHVVAYTREYMIDDIGNRIGERGSTPKFASAEPHVRVATALSSKVDGGPPSAIFGVMRRSVLKQTRLHGGYTGSDRVLMVELALRGPLYEVNEPLFSNRDHADRSIRISEKVGERGHPREAWFDTARAGKIVFPSWRRLVDFTTAIAQAPVPVSSKLRSYGVLAQWLSDRNWKRLVRDLQIATLMSVDRSRRPAIPDGPSDLEPRQ